MGDREKFERALTKLTLGAEMVLLTGRGGWGRAYVRLEGRRRWWRLSDGKVVRVDYDPWAAHERQVRHGRRTLTWTTVSHLRDVELGALHGQLGDRVRELREGFPHQKPEGMDGIRAAMDRLSEALVTACNALQKGEAVEEAKGALKRVRDEAKGIEKALNGVVAGS